MLKFISNKMFSSSIEARYPQIISRFRVSFRLTYIIGPIKIHGFIYERFRKGLLNNALKTLGGPLIVDRLSLLFWISAGFR